MLFRFLNAVQNLPVESSRLDLQHFPWSVYFLWPIKTVYISCNSDMWPESWVIAQVTALWGISQCVQPVLLTELWQAEDREII